LLYSNSGLGFANANGVTTNFSSKYSNAISDHNSDHGYSQLLNAANNELSMSSVIS